MGSSLDTLVMRDAILCDIDEIAPLFSRSFRLLTFVPELHTALEDRAYLKDYVLKSQKVRLVHSAKTLMGFSAMSKDWVHMLYVHPEHLRCGVGSMLMTDLQDRHDALQLWCFEQNIGARKFYEHHGFEIAEVTDGAGNEEKCPDIRYVWKRG